jgi:hypothetical protein
MTMARSASNEYVFTMRLDASDFRRLFSASGGGGGPSGPGAAKGAGPGGTPQKQGGGLSGPGLLAVLGIGKGVMGLVQNSNVANAYLGAMGKMFGAAIDLLLIPFIPLFNLIMVGLSMLIRWLVTSGALEYIGKVMDRAVGYLIDIAKWVSQFMGALHDMDFTKAGGMIVTGIWSALKALVHDPLGVIVATLLAMKAVQIAASVVGGILNFATFGTAGMAGTALLAKLGIGRAAATAAEVAAPAAAGTAGGAGLLATLGPILVSLGTGLIAQKGTQWALDKTGVAKPGSMTGDVLSYAAGGAAAGATLGLFGGPFAPLTVTGGAIAGGLIGGGVGFLKHQLSGGGGQQQGAQGGGNNVQNSYNTIYLSQQNYFNNQDAQQASQRMADDLAKRLGFTLSRSAGATPVGSSIQARPWLPGSSGGGGGGGGSW